MNPFKKISLGVYYSGIVVSSLLGIRDELRESNHRINSNAGFAISCFGGAMTGGFVGFLWPLTMIGKGIWAIDTVSKNN